MMTFIRVKIHQPNYMIHEYLLRYLIFVRNLHYSQLVFIFRSIKKITNNRRSSETWIVKRKKKKSNYKKFKVRSRRWRRCKQFHSFIHCGIYLKAVCATSFPALSVERPDERLFKFPQRNSHKQAKTTWWVNNLRVINFLLASSFGFAHDRSWEPEKNGKETRKIIYDIWESNVREKVHIRLTWNALGKVASLSTFIKAFSSWINNFVLFHPKPYHIC